MDSGTGDALYAGYRRSRFKSSALLPTAPQLAHLRALHRANTLPPVTSSFRDVIDNAPEELARYDSEIAEIQTILDDLKSERNALASYAAGCCSLFAPVRRMPNELLAEIFENCAPPKQQYQISNEATAEVEIERLAHRYLLRVSQVSKLWHDIAMGTPRLWSTIAVDTSLWNTTNIPADTLLAALASSLARSADSPLVLEFAAEAHDPKSSDVLDLVCMHAGRWRDVYMWIDAEASRALARVKGNLPLLETLSITGQSAPKLGFFEDAPSLVDANFAGLPQNIPTLPWHQLQKFRYTAHSYRDALNSLIYTSSLPHHCQFCLDIELSKSPTSWRDLPPSPVSADMGCFILTTTLSAGTAQSWLGGIFDALTLSHLKELVIMSDSGPPLVWSQAGFFSLAQRSDFSNHLVSLTMVAIITEEEVLQCLGLLPLLEGLALTDFSTHRKHTLITDSLLHALSWPGQMLAPRLSSLRLVTLLEFTDDTYIDLITSRLNPERLQNPPHQFTARLRPFSTCARELGANLHAVVGRLVAQGRLQFISGTAPPGR